MAVEHLKPDSPATLGRPRSENSFPTFNLAESLKVADVIHKHGGGTATAEQLSSYLGYKSTNNGSYLGRVGSARAFGFVTKNGDAFTPSPLAMRIISPVYESEKKKAVVEAFSNVQLFKKVYEDFRGKELPPGFGMKNALRNQYGIVPNRVDLAYRILMESAEQAGFFATRQGAKTHLIMPSFGAAEPIREIPAQPDVAHGGGDGGDRTGDAQQATERRDDGKPSTGAQPSSLGDAKAQYVASLIRLFEKKSADGTLDEKLMERIERLLGAAT